jgi:hypothetical protein
MALLAEHHVTATPGRRVLEVYDADAFLGDSAALDAAEVQVVAGNGYHLYLLSLQSDMPSRSPSASGTPHPGRRPTPKATSTSASSPKRASS